MQEVAARSGRGEKADQPGPTDCSEQFAIQDPRSEMGEEMAC